MRLLHKLIRAVRKVKVVNLSRWTNKIFILGFQKSGTTIIAALLAKAVGKSVTLDISGEYMNEAILDKVITEGWPMKKIVSHYPDDFNNHIIKEPSLSPYYHQLCEMYPKSRFVMVSRDPRDNIRSILNRHNLPGNLDRLSASHVKSMNSAWQLVFNSSWLGIDEKPENYISMLAHRWKMISHIYLQNQTNIHLVNYTEFVENKVGLIEELAASLGEPVVNDIESVVDVQYQPKGDNSKSWKDYYGDRNLEIIERVCEEEMEKLGY